MKLSCIICSYNQGAFLEESILSVIQQDYRDKEIILIDGGSDDESLNIIKKYQCHFSYWVSETDRGQTHAINKGIDHANGDIVGWLNSDDIYLPGCFSKVAGVFQDKPDTSVVHGNRVMFDAESMLNGWSSPGPFTPEINYYNICSEAAFWNGRFTRDGERLKEELRFAMDLEWFTRLYAEYGNFHYLNDFLGGFRCHEASKSATMDDVRREEGPREWERLLGYGVPECKRRNWEHIWSLTKPRYTLVPTLKKKLLGMKTSVRPPKNASI